MRIVSRSDSPSFPPLESLQESWASEAERENEAPCLLGEDEISLRDTERVKQIRSSCQNSSKILNSGYREAYHRSCVRENEFSSKRASRSFNSEPYRNDQDNLRRYNSSRSGSRNSEGASRAWRLTSSSRCYPPSVHIRSSDFSATEKKRSFQHYDQSRRDLHEAQSYAKPDKSFGLFPSNALLQCPRGTQDVELSVNTGEARAGFSLCLNYKTEMEPGHEVSKKHRDHVNNCQELDEGKLKYISSVGKNGHRGYRRHSEKANFSESKCQQSSAGYCNDVAYCKNEKHHQSRGARDWQTKQHNGGVLIKQSFEEKTKPTLNEAGTAASRPEIITENALTELNMLRSDCHGELGVEMDDSLGVTQKQYEMLASLFMDDSLDIDKDFDVTIASAVPDSDCSGSIFGDDLELPVSMDADIVAEGKGGMSVKAGEVDGYHDNMARKAVTKVPAWQPAGKSHNVCASSGLKKYPTVFVDVTNKFEIHGAPGVKEEVQEDDGHRLSQRQRQIEFGKNTLGYERYSELIPRFKRKAKDPQTPNPKQVCSKRSWDGQIRKWRRLLHVYDPPSEDGEETAEDFSVKLHRGHLGEKVFDAEAHHTRLTHRFSESDENKVCNAVDRENVEDSSLTIYDDWMES